MDAAARITGSEQVALAGACSGGIIAAMVAAHLAHTGQQDRLAALTLMVTVLDQAGAGLASAVIDERTARLAAAASGARGYLDGRSLAEVFAWLRPNDLIWNYWVNNYPPDNAKARYQIGKDGPEDPQEWLRRAETCHGSWWPDYADWLSVRTGDEKAAPAELAGGGLELIGEAPGTYVYDH